MCLLGWQLLLGCRNFRSKVDWHRANASVGVDSMASLELVVVAGVASLYLLLLFVGIMSVDQLLFVDVRFR